MACWAALAFVVTACFRLSACYHAMPDSSYSMKDAFMRILGDPLLSNQLNRLEDLMGEDPRQQLPAVPLGYAGPQLGDLRRYPSQMEVAGSYNTNSWDEDSVPAEDDAEYFDRVAKDNEEHEFMEQQRLMAAGADDEFGGPSSMNNQLANSPMPRDQEYLQHSSLWGHQFIQGGAGEGSQMLKPEGNQKNSQEMKTDAMLPAYCDPPNPCPVGYTAEDGCLEDFTNTAAFSRAYQEAQDCLCDAEHMFGCGEPRNGPGDGGNADEDTFNSLINNYNILGEHKTLVAKKFHSKKSTEAAHVEYEKDIRERAKKAALKFSKNPTQKINEFLQGEKLPIAAKKGMKLA